jgi:exosortase/archaeosortase family protein
VWWYAIITALLGATAMQLSQRLWGPTATLTFDLVRRVLSPLMPTLQADPATHVLSSEHFAVQISEVCSGLEGMGLMLALTSAWIVYFRREYFFPRVLILVPIGLLTIFVLNILRIAALMFIGDAGFQEIAEYGFHSQAEAVAAHATSNALIAVSVLWGNQWQLW